MMKKKGEKKKLDINSQAYMKKLGRLCKEAIRRGPEGLMTIAAFIAPPIKAAIEQKLVTPMILTRHVMPVGEKPIYQKETEIKAYWIARGGDPRVQDIGEDEVQFDTDRIHANPLLDVKTLKRGNVGSIQSMQRLAAKAIREEIDKRTFVIIEAAVTAAMTVTITGGVLTEQGLTDAFTLMEDLGLTVGTIAMRAARHGDIKMFTNTPDPIGAEIRKKGVVGVYSGAMVLTTTAIADPADVYLFPKDEEIGKYPIDEDLMTEAEKKGFKVGFLSYMEVGMGITQPGYIAKIRVNP